MRLGLVAVWAAAGILTLPAGAWARALEATELGRVDRAVPVSAFGEAAAWSQYSQSRRGFVLMTRDREGVRQARVRPRPVPFDVDLGPGRGGGVVAVYSRCRREQEIPQGFGTYPHDVREPGRGCDLFQHHPGRRGESRIAAASTRAASEFNPTIWRSKVAFASKRPGHRVTLHVVDLSTGRRTTLRGGSSGAGALPTRLDLRASEVAYGWRRPVARCADTVTPDDGRTRPMRTEMWWDSPGGRHRLVETACEYGRVFSVAWPSLTGDGLIYHRLDQPADEVRYALRHVPRSDGSARDMVYEAESWLLGVQLGGSDGTGVALRHAPDDYSTYQVVSGRFVIADAAFGGARRSAR